MLRDPKSAGVGRAVIQIRNENRYWRPEADYSRPELKLRSELLSRPELVAGWSRAIVSTALHPFDSQRAERTRTLHVPGGATQLEDLEANADPYKNDCAIPAAESVCGERKQQHRA